jgi:hypothetical protein
MIYARTHHDPANAPGLIRSATEKLGSQKEQASEAMVRWAGSLYSRPASFRAVPIVKNYCPKKCKYITVDPHQ